MKTKTLPLLSKNITEYLWSDIADFFVIFSKITSNKKYFVRILIAISHDLFAHVASHNLQGILHLCKTC